MLAELIGPQPAGIHYVEYLQGNGPTIFSHACGLGLEGVVSKGLDSQYRSGNTVRWVKSKCSQRGQFIIAGFIPNSANGRVVGALILAEKVGDDDLIWPAVLGPDGLQRQPSSLSTLCR